MEYVQFRGQFWLTHLWCAVLGLLYFMYFINLFFSSKYRLARLVFLDILDFYLWVEVMWMINYIVNYIYILVWPGKWYQRNDQYQQIGLVFRSFFVRLWEIEQWTTQDIDKMCIKKRNLFFLLQRGRRWRRLYNNFELLYKNYIFIIFSSLKGANQRLFFYYRCDCLNNKWAKLYNSRWYWSYGSFFNLEREAKIKSKELIPLLIECLVQGCNPMLKYGVEVSALVFLKQKLLCVSAESFGIQSLKTQVLVNNFLCSLEFRLLAVENLLRHRVFRTPGFGGVFLTFKNVFSFINKLSYNNILYYKFSIMKWDFLSKNEKELRIFGIFKIYDRFVQMLFVLVYEPIIDPYSDLYSFGYRTGRYAHQAIGLLAFWLSGIYSKECFSKYPKFILKYELRKNFSKVAQAWLLFNFPIPSKFRFILVYWVSFVKIFGGNSIGLLFGNFMLNGLVDIFKPLPSKYLCIFRRCWFKNQNRGGFQLFKSSRISIIIKMVRFINNFVVVTNSSRVLVLLKIKINDFLRSCGFIVNFKKFVCFLLRQGRVFDFLGFTFRYFIVVRSSRFTKKVNKFGQVCKFRPGLFVYISNQSISIFKFKLKVFFKYAKIYSVFFLIRWLNLILREWLHYFGLGNSYRIVDLLDRFVFKQCFKFICKKFSRVSKQKIVLRFFLLKIGNRFWNFNVGAFWRRKVNSSNQGVILIRMLTLFHWVSVILLRPSAEELCNVFIHKEICGKWVSRINKFRYKKI